MAHVEHRPNVNVIIPETVEERALIAHGEQSGKTLVLLEGLYPVHDQALVLPDTSDVRASQRICSAFERAAAAHHQAVLRRRDFKLVKS